MNNLLIEPTIDFFSELKKLKQSIDCSDETDKDKNVDNSDRCLITHEVLKDPYISFPCEHKFNYLPLYNEITRQKTRNKKFNSLECTYLAPNQIKCPYCRKIYNFVLPYIPIADVTRVNGVNSPNKWCYMPNRCNYIFKSGKNKNSFCDVKCYGELCQKHSKANKKIENSNNELSVCKTILKSGTRKGCECGLKIYSHTDNTNNLCRRHFNFEKKHINKVGD